MDLGFQLIIGVYVLLGVTFMLSKLRIKLLNRGTISKTTSSQWIWATVLAYILCLNLLLKILYHIFFDG
jgi:hypothetical protein